MKKLLQISLILLATVFSGCSLVNGIDSMIPRPVIPVKDAFLVELRYEDQVIAKEIYCEKYYDAMPAARGNFWAYREVGFESEYQFSEIEVIDDKIGVIRFSVPLCNDLVKADTLSIRQINVNINDKNYGIIESNENGHVCKRFDENEVLLDFSIKVNGVPLKGVETGD